MSIQEQTISDAERQGRQSIADEPRAQSARYDSASKRVIVELTNGCSFTFPSIRAEGLTNATDAELSQVEILGAGYGLHWESLDVDLSVPGLLLGLFGTKSYMDRMRAAQGGKATSAPKSAAARSNGLKGGRPRKAG